MARDDERDQQEAKRRAIVILVGVALWVVAAWAWVLA